MGYCIFLTWLCINSRSKIVEEELTSMLARSMTESEIAQQLGVDQSTISRDIKVLKESVNNLFMTWQSLIWLTTISSQSMELKKQRKSHGKYTMTKQFL